MCLLTTARIVVAKRKGLCASLLLSVEAIVTRVERDWVGLGLFVKECNGLRDFKGNGLSEWRESEREKEKRAHSVNRPFLVSATSISYSDSHRIMPPFSMLCFLFPSLLFHALVNMPVLPLSHDLFIQWMQQGIEKGYIRDCDPTLNGQTYLSTSFIHQHSIDHVRQCKGKLSS